MRVKKKNSQIFAICMYPCNMHQFENMCMDFVNKYQIESKLLTAIHLINAQTNLVTISLLEAGELAVSADC